MSELHEIIRELFGHHHRDLERRLAEIVSEALQPIHDQLRGIQMSETQLQADLTAQTAAVQALATEVSDGLAANATAIQALKDQIAAGSPVTAADLATLEGNTSAVQAATTALQAALNPAPAPTP